jgi:5-hydroxyisourate hydrolase-like protein (transthyretin family)
VAAVGSVTVHVHDWAYGRPAPGVRVALRRPGGAYDIVVTETDGTGGCRLDHDGTGCLLVIDVARYFAALGVGAGYTEVGIACRRLEGMAVIVTIAPFGHAVYLGR